MTDELESFDRWARALLLFARMACSSAKLCQFTVLAAALCLVLTVSCGSDDGGAADAGEVTSTRTPANARYLRLAEICGSAHLVPCPKPFCMTGCVSAGSESSSGCVAGCVPGFHYVDVTTVQECQARCERELMLTWYSTSAVDAGDYPEQERARCAETCSEIIGESEPDGG